ncbi:MAG TPA: alkaline phosphatase D family protein, partial [Kofleriaceae bacterium]|nr:alkaline phosphatase D family protein [Kofleriaceae bacterium]
MAGPNRREFLELAAALGATLAWGCARTAPLRYVHRSEHFPQGVASGDPDEHSVLLWTRRPPLAGSSARSLTAQVAEDPAFERIVATATAELSAASDWTARVLAADLAPARVYWYRFVDDTGSGSRIGRTITAPAPGDPRPVQFAFVSCQNVCQGAQNAYRRMIFEDEHRAEADRLGFVLHLGDFFYEIVWYPEDRPKGMYARRLRDLVRFSPGEKVRDFHVPITLDDYRALFHAYLQDPDLQDARARWPFVCMWDNHEFSWKGWQSFVNFDGSRPAQTRKVAAAQAWFEFQPARVFDPAGRRVTQFAAPAVSDAPVAQFDDHGLGQEPNNLAAIASLKLYRSLRWGAHLDLVLTDNRSFQMEPAMARPEAEPFQSKGHPYLAPDDVIAILDAGRSFAGGHPPATIRFGGRDLPNPRLAHPPQTALGVAQKAWFLQRLERSTATWKVWGNSFGTLDARTDLHNLPPGLGAPWPGAGFASTGGTDWTGYRTERAEIFDFVRSRKLTGFAIVSGDRHSFWAGLVSRSLPPEAFEPVGVEFIT